MSLSIKSQTCSITLRSCDWDGYWIVDMSCCSNYATVQRVAWAGALSCWNTDGWFLSPNNFSTESRSKHNRMMQGIVVVFLMPCALASTCVPWDLCHYPDTKPLGTPFLDIPTKHINPVSCAATCAQTDGCVGVTLDSQEEMCHLYEESYTFGITLNPGTALWLNQGAVSIRKTVVPGMAIPMLKIRRPNGRLIFNMEIAIRR